MAFGGTGAPKGMVPDVSQAPDRCALVLAGGGARGAYGAGVMRYVRGEFAQELGFQPRVDLFSGTSIGAINACFLAGTAHVPEKQGEALTEVWRSLRLEEVYQWGTLRPLTFARHLWHRLREKRGTPAPLRFTDLIVPEALVRLVERRIDWDRLHDNVRVGTVSAVTVTATNLASGQAVVYVESRYEASPFDLGFEIEVRSRKLGPEHALASGAIPLLFRPVPIEGSFYVDGSVRLSVPLLPALHLGATKILIVALRDPPKESERNAQDPTLPPSSVAQLGRVLSALLADHTDHDLARLLATNDLVLEGERAFGPAFADRLGGCFERSLGYPLHRVRPLVIRPSRDLGQIAREHARRRLSSMRTGTLAARLLRHAAEASSSNEEHAADLASYLLFDTDYAEDLIDLGEADAKERREELRSFFGENEAEGVKSA